MTPSQRSCFALALAAFAITAPRLYFHELWRDEAWIWIGATQSPSLPDLFHELIRNGQG